MLKKITLALWNPEAISTEHCSPAEHSLRNTAIRDESTAIQRFQSTEAYSEWI